MSQDEVMSNSEKSTAALCIVEVCLAEGKGVGTGGAGVP